MERDVPHAHLVERVVRRAGPVGERHAAQVGHQHLCAVGTARHHHHRGLELNVHAAGNNTNNSKRRKILSAELDFWKPITLF